jgi:hypothetical protein
MKQDEKTQLWIAIGNQPGTGAWFSVWRVCQFTRVRHPNAKAAKKLPSQACTA